MGKRAKILISGVQSSYHVGDNNRPGGGSSQGLSHSVSVDSSCNLLSSA